MSSAEKRTTLAACLNRGLTAIAFDSRQPGVNVPEGQRQQRLILNLSYRFAAVDLQVSEWGVRCCLSFGGENHKVEIPWGAIYAMRGNAEAEEAAVWDMPPEPPRFLKRLGIMGVLAPVEEPALTGAA